MSKKTKTETKKQIEQIALMGTTCLRAKIRTTVSEREYAKNTKNHTYCLINKKVLSETKETVDFSLVPVTEEEISYLREKEIPSFVLKIGEALFHAEIPKNLNLVSVNLFGSTHKCANECGLLSVLHCEKVRNKASFIERYPFIKIGYESFSTDHDAFVVIECNHYEKLPKKKPRTVTEINKDRLSVAQFVWDDVEDLVEVQKRKMKNNATSTRYSR